MKTSAAYILFYQRRNPTTANARPPPPLVHINNGNGLITNHWCRTLLKKQHKGTLSSLLNSASNKSQPNSITTTDTITSSKSDHDEITTVIENGTSTITKVTQNGHHNLEQEEEPESAHLTNGYHTEDEENYNETNNRKSISNSNNKAPLARMDEALGLSLAIKDIHQIESTV